MLGMPIRRLADEPLELWTSMPTCPDCVFDCPSFPDLGDIIFRCVGLSERGSTWWRKLKVANELGTVRVGSWRCQFSTAERLLPSDNLHSKVGRCVAGTCCLHHKRQLDTIGLRLSII